jgi:hypothetical protein
VENEVKITFKQFIAATAFAIVLAVCSVSVEAGEKYETIDATAWGTSTQLGSNINIKLLIFQYSTTADRQILVDAYKSGQNKGLVDALQKMKAVGRIQITGTTGYEVAYIRMIPTPTGRKIRFVTNRLIRFGEAYANSQSQAFNLTAGEINLNDKDNKKSDGTLFPAAQLVVNNKGELQWDLRQNPWRLGNIIDWKGSQEN